MRRTGIVEVCGRHHGPGDDLAGGEVDGDRLREGPADVDADAHAACHLGVDGRAPGSELRSELPSRVFERAAVGG